MTDTRLKIIEIIKDYMDKTPSKGCLFYTKEEDDTRCADVILCKGTLEEMVHLNKYLGWNGVDDEEDIDLYEVFDCNPYEIIGHYDITALVKYLQFHCNKYINLKYTKTKYGQDSIEVPQEDCLDIIIPNKPLHLYTEQDDEKILKLLETIANTR